MLVLTRKKGEDIFIGDDVRIVVVAIQGSRVALGLEAHCDVPIRRGEIPDWGEMRQESETPYSLLGQT